MPPTTRRQREILDYLKTYITAHQYAPSFDEIARHFAFNSLATVHEHLTNLERKGLIRRAHNESRGIEITPEPGQAGATELPLLGSVAAGAPIEAISTPETIAVPNDLVPPRGSSYVLRVTGDSMIDEHIVDGDLVVVQSRNSAENGETVIALVDGTSATVKRIYREAGGWVRLQPANEKVAPIRVHEDDLVIQGAVVGVIRKM
jgi:repressor LexA